MSESLLIHVHPVVFLLIVIVMEKVDEQQGTHTHTHTVWYLEVGGASWRAGLLCVVLSGTWTTADLSPCCVHDGRSSRRLFVLLHGNTALQITSSLFVTLSAVSGSVSCPCLLLAFSLPSSRIQCLKAVCEVYNVSVIIQDVNKSGWSEDFRWWRCSRPSDAANWIGMQIGQITLHDSKKNRQYK